VLVDTHSHVNLDAFDADREVVLERAREAGVERLVCIGMGLEGGREALDLARAHPGRVYASVGFHPYDAAAVDDAALRALGELLAAPEMVLVGEMGVDTVKAEVPLEVQEEAFARQLGLARELDLPVCIHSREAFPACERVIRRVAPEGWRGFAHCFSDGPDEALAWRRLGFTVSFAGQITFENKSAEPIREAARRLAPGEAVVETDAPFLAPTPHRGRRNEPAHVRHTAEKLAALQGLAPEEGFARATKAARAVLGI